MNTVVISVGSNINSEKNIEIARRIISERLVLLKSSSFVETEPIGFKDQDNFQNGAFLVETGLDKKALNSLLKEIEYDMGRVKDSNKSGPRIIDMDIIVWNGKIVDEDVHNREFLRKAVLELLPGFKI